VTTRILVIEDDAALAALLRDNLMFEGYTVDIAGDALEALAKASANSPDLVLLDLMLPGRDGFDVCQQVSEQFPRTSIVVLSARQEAADKIRALGLGADDYVTKPWAFDELIARIRAILRRTHPGIGRLQVGDAVIDFSAREASYCGARIFLTTREFELLQFLAERRGRVATREEILRVVWGYRESTLTRTVDNFIARLRRKIEADPRHPHHILTAHGGGYYLLP
jgi:two-component system response regulator VicR